MMERQWPTVLATAVAAAIGGLGIIPQAVPIGVDWAGIIKRQLCLLTQQFPKTVRAAVTKSILKHHRLYKVYLRHNKLQAL